MGKALPAHAFFRDCVGVVFFDDSLSTLLKVLSSSGMSCHQALTSH